MLSPDGQSLQIVNVNDLQCEKWEGWCMVGDNHSVLGLMRDTSSMSRASPAQRSLASIDHLDVEHMQQQISHWLHSIGIMYRPGYSVCKLLCVRYCSSLCWHSCSAVRTLAGSWPSHRR